MSKDFTPQILHVLDKHYHFSKEPLVLTNIDTGEETTLYDPTCEYAIRWPNAYYLGHDIVEQNHALYTDLDFFEETILKVIKLDDNNERLPADASEFEKTVELWYLGKLDPNFYYSTHNDELMSEAVSKLGISY